MEEEYNYKVRMLGIVEGYARESLADELSTVTKEKLDKAIARVDTVSSAVSKTFSDYSDLPTNKDGDTSKSIEELIPPIKILSKNRYKLANDILPKLVGIFENLVDHTGSKKEGLIHTFANKCNLTLGDPPFVKIVQNNGALCSYGLVEQDLTSEKDLGKLGYSKSDKIDEEDYSKPFIDYGKRMKEAFVKLVDMANKTKVQLADENTDGKREHPESVKYYIGVVQRISFATEVLYPTIKVICDAIYLTTANVNSLLSGNKGYKPGDEISGKRKKPGIPAEDEDTSLDDDVPSDDIGDDTESEDELGMDDDLSVDDDFV